MPASESLNSGIKNCQILIVDDDREDQEILLQYFQIAGNGDQVHFVDNGLEALEYVNAVKDARFLPRLIVLDLNMPILSGTQTLLRIKQSQRLSHIPVVIFSTSTNEIEKQRCLNYGAMEYIVKPSTYEEGQAMVAKFVSFIAR